MTAADVIAGLAEIGARVVVQGGAAKVNLPVGFDRREELAPLMDLVRLHRAEILALSEKAVEPWACQACRRAFYVSEAEVREYVGATECWFNPGCPWKRG